MLANPPLHLSWVRNTQATAKCDFCNLKKRPLQTCKDCYINICKDCMVAGTLEHNARHKVSPASVDNFDWSMDDVIAKAQAKGNVKADGKSKSKAKGATKSEAKNNTTKNNGKNKHRGTSFSEERDEEQQNTKERTPQQQQQLNEHLHTLQQAEAAYTAAAGAFMTAILGGSSPRDEHSSEPVQSQNETQMLHHNNMVDVAPEASVWAPEMEELPTNSNANTGIVSVAPMRLSKPRFLSNPNLSDPSLPLAPFAPVWAPGMEEMPSNLNMPQLASQAGTHHNNNHSVFYHQPQQHQLQQHHLQQHHAQQYHAQQYHAQRLQQPVQLGYPSSTSHNTRAHMMPFVSGSHPQQHISNMGQGLIQHVQNLGSMVALPAAAPHNYSAPYNFVGRTHQTSQQNPHLHLGGGGGGATQPVAGSILHGPPGPFVGPAALHPQLLHQQQPKAEQKEAKKTKGANNDKVVRFGPKDKGKKRAAVAAAAEEEEKDATITMTTKHVTQGHSRKKRRTSSTAFTAEENGNSMERLRQIAGAASALQASSRAQLEELISDDATATVKDSSDTESEKSGSEDGTTKAEAGSTPERDNKTLEAATTLLSMFSQKETEGSF